MRFQPVVLTIVLSSTGGARLAHANEEHLRHRQLDGGEYERSSSTTTLDAQSTRKAAQNEPSGFYDVADFEGGLARDEGSRGYKPPGDDCPKPEPPPKCIYDEGDGKDTCSDPYLTCQKSCLPALCEIIPHGPPKHHNGYGEPTRYVPIGSICAWWEYAGRGEPEVCCIEKDDSESYHPPGCTTCYHCKAEQVVNEACCAWFGDHDDGRSGVYNGCPGDEECCKCGEDEYKCIPKGTYCTRDVCGPPPETPAPQVPQTPAPVPDATPAPTPAPQVPQTPDPTPDPSPAPTPDPTPGPTPAPTSFCESQACDCLNANPPDNCDLGNPSNPAKKINCLSDADCPDTPGQAPGRVCCGRVDEGDCETQCLGMCAGTPFEPFNARPCPPTVAPAATPEPMP